MDPPPCLKPGEALNACARAVYAFEVNATADLSAEWAGWRLRGRVLISPDGDRISPARLRGLLFVEAGRLRAPKTTATIYTLNSGLHGDGPKKNLSVRLEAPTPDNRAQVPEPPPL